MLHNNELIAVLFAFAVALFLFLFRESVYSIRFVRFLLLGFAFVCASLVCTIVEEYLWYDVLNLCEHVFNLLSTASLVIWLWAISRNVPQAR